MNLRKDILFCKKGKRIFDPQRKMKRLNYLSIQRYFIKKGTEQKLFTSKYC